MQSVVRSIVHARHNSCTSVAVSTGVRCPSNVVISSHNRQVSTNHASRALFSFAWPHAMRRLFAKKRHQLGGSSKLRDVSFCFLHAKFESRPLAHTEVCHSLSPSSPYPRITQTQNPPRNQFRVTVRQVGTITDNTRECAQPNLPKLVNS